MQFIGVELKLQSKTSIEVLMILIRCIVLFAICEAVYETLAQWELQRKVQHVHLAGLVSKTIYIF